MDVSEYWKKRGPGYQKELQDKPYYEKAQFKNQQKYAIKLINDSDSKTILEIGCGTGRYTKILYSILKPNRYVAVDISKEQLENAKRYVGIDKIEFICSKIQDFEPHEKFDLVFASEVLMHIDFIDIKKIITKLVAHSNKKIVLIDWFDQKQIGREEGGYCFMHDYETLFKNSGIKNIKIHKLPLALSSKIVNIYAKLRKRRGIEKQAIIEVDV